MTTSWKALDHIETSRTYVYPDGSKFKVESVCLLAVSPSGTHYIETIHFDRIIVAPGWRAIFIETNDWTYPGPSNEARQKRAQLQQNR